MTFREIRFDELDETIAATCLPVLRKALETAGKMHRLRVVDLPPTVMHRLCVALQGDERWKARVLCADAPQQPYEATATKLVQMRDHEPRPLVMFMPGSVRTPAEDSLDIATFQQVQFGAVVERIVRELGSSMLAALPPEERNEMERYFADFGREIRQRKVLRDPDTYLRYLLTWKANGGSLEAAGRAMFVLGLVPDPLLFRRGPQLLTWLTRNIEAVGTLTDPRRPLQERVGRLKLRTGTIQPRLFQYVRAMHSPGRRAWTSAITVDPAWKDLEFDQWPFDDAGSTQQVRLLLEDLPLPKQAEDKLTGSVAMKVWDLRTAADLKVSFRSIPAPAEVEAWKHYRIQILEQGEEAPNLLWESPNFAKPKKNAKVSRTLKASDVSGHIKEGVYYLRVEAFGADGAVLTKEPDPERKDKGLRPENESELLLIAESEVIVDPPKEPRALFADSLLDAWFDLRGTVLLSAGKHRDPVPAREAMTGLWDTAENAAVKDEVRFEVSADGAQGRTVRMPGLLRKVEYRALNEPDHLGGYRLNLKEVRNRADVVVEPEEATPLEGPELDAFLVARRQVFAAILAQPRIRNLEGEDAKKAGVVEVADLLSLETEITTYARCWVRLSQAFLTAPASVERSQTLATLARTDVVQLRWRWTSADPGRGALILPLHPLRLLWHLQHARVRHDGISALAEGSADVPDRKQFLDALDSEIFPTNLPLVVFDRRGRALIEQDFLTPFWALYLPAESEAKHHDVNHAREQARRLLGVKRGTGRLGEIHPSVLADRLFDYLRRHPYVEQLSINVFNPGEAERIADTLRRLEALRRAVPGDEPPELRYAVHLFSAKEYVERAGEAVDALLDPERQVAEDDEFTVGAASHLRPKLLIARSTHEEFARCPEDFRAHITVLLEQFRVDGRLRSLADFSRGSFVRGLVLESETRLEASTGLYGWIRGVRPSAPGGRDPVETLLVETAAIAHRVQAGAVGGSGGEDEAPVIALYLDPTEQALLRNIHDVSDQVLTIDRNLGLDYFDSATGSADVGYLLDFSPAFLQGDGERLLVTTRCTEELVALIVPALETVGLKLPDGQEAVVVEALRSVSGRIALRLFSGHAATQEVIGLLLARWLLERSGLLTERILVPVDAHQDWFAGEGSQQRADLMLADVDPLTRTIDLTIVEVKARTHLGTAERTQLYREMREQAENTQTRLLARFDLEAGRKARADSLLRSKELFSLLSFYLGRAVRYGLVSAAKELEIRAFLSTIDQGYRLRLRTRGIVYAADARGNHVDEDEPAFPVHRFGLDTAQAMLDAAVGDRPVEPTTEERPESVRPTVAPLTDVDVDKVRSLFDAPRRTQTVRPAAAPAEREPEVSLAGTAPPAPAPGTVSPEPVAVAEQRPAPALPRPEPEAKREPLPENIGFVTLAATPSTAAEEPTPALIVAEPARARTTPQPDILLGASEITAQYGLFARFGSAKVAIDLTGCNTVSLFGVQGFGKSYTLGVIAEMGAQSMDGINKLETPLATVLFHYHKSDAYEPEYAAAVEPNNKAREIDRLLQEYQARPEGLRDLVLLVPEAKLAQRKTEYPGIAVHPIKFSSSELGADSWKFLLAAFGNDSLYVRQIIAIMRRHRDRLTFDALKAEIAEAELSPATRRLAEDRLMLAEPYIDDSASLRNLLRPGRTIIVDLRDEWLEKEDALGLFVVMMKTFSQAKYEGRQFNKLMVFDEAHKYITESELIGQVVEIIREMRHQATSVVIASQDPLSVPRAVIELTSLLVLHRMTSPAWLKHLKTAISALDGVHESHVASLVAGEALVWCQRSTDKRFTEKPQKVLIRPRVTKHGGGTKTAVEGATVR